MAAKKKTGGVVTQSGSGRQFVVIEGYGTEGYVERFADSTQLRIILSENWFSTYPGGSVPRGEAVVFPRLGIALVDELPAGVASASQFGKAEPERVVTLLKSPKKTAAASVASACTRNSARFAWALQVTGADRWTEGSEDVRVCVIDGGINLGHRDFTRRRPAPTASFCGLPSAVANRGHCTHCAGLIGGLRQRNPPHVPTMADPERYSVAPGVQIAIARVFLDDEPWIPEGRVYAALDWALANGCHVASMSFGFPWKGADHSATFELAAQRALAQGCVIVAATGNSSRRPHKVDATFHPARCPTVVAVGSVDNCLVPSKFSNGATATKGGKVDLVAPGQTIYSAWINQGHHSRPGTSMSTAIVAGIAALHKTKNPGLTGPQLRNELLRRFQALPFSSDVVGRGLALAPT
jgi:hypothetical protein